MISFLKNFFFLGRRDNATVAERSTRGGMQQAAPGTEIHYDKNLIPRFKSHHYDLVQEISRVKKLVNAGDYQGGLGSLRTFKSLLQQHLLEENLLFYTYLHHCLTNDAEGRDLMSEMRSEMGEIGRLVTRFIKHYLEFGVDVRNAGKFDTELSSIISALGDRIAREESSLYKLYLPPSDFTLNSSDRTKRY